MIRRRPYSETSLLLELLTSDSRSVHAIYRGAKRQHAVPIDLFCEYSMSWRARMGLVTLRSCELETTYALSDEALYAGLYLNELLRRGIHENQQVERVYGIYSDALTRLNDHANELEKTLRVFERKYLSALGYAISFDREQSSGHGIDAAINYAFEPREGFCRASESSSNQYSGRVLLDISSDDFHSEESRRVAKLVLRQALDHHLGEREIKARTLLSAKQYRDAASETTRYD